MPLILKICGSTWSNASRDRRELALYRELGADVAVLAKGEQNEKGRKEELDGFSVYRYSTRPFGAHIPNPINRAASLFTWSHFTRKLNPDVISGHDLIPGLTIAWMATLFKKNKPKLIYDSHEFELGRNVKRGKFFAWIIRTWECFLIKRCAFSIMVNESIADEVQRIHKLNKRPIVVRSTPDYWTIDEEVCKEQHRLFKEAFTKPEGVNYLLMYHGAVVRGRGIERLIEAVAQLEGVGLVILGNGSDDYIASLQIFIRDRKVEDRVLFHPAVPLAQLWKYIGAVDLSLIMIQPVAKSYYYALPNKFFESIQALTPMVASNFPEMKRIIDQYEIGLTCDPENLEEINACVERMRTDRAFYVSCKDNLKKAKSDLCWEKEKTVLIDAFKQFIGEIDR